MGSNATLNIRLPEELKERGMEVLARQRISVSDAVRQLFCELERSQKLPEFMQSSRIEEAAQEKRRLLREMTGTERKPPDALYPPIESKGHDWKGDWRNHLLEKHGERSL